MTVRERQRSGTLTDFSVCFQLMLSYRIPMQVKDVMVFPRFPEKDDIYYRCPRRRKLLDFPDYRKAKRTRLT